MTKSLSYVGKKKNLALFMAQGKAVLVNTNTLTASVMSADTINATHPRASWKQIENADPVWGKLASAALQRELAPQHLSTSESFKRTYTVPKRVVETALLSERTNGVRTPVAEHVATLLSSGNQVSCEDVLWISRFFDNHSEETTDACTWRSWGGSEGARWANGLATRLDYDSVVADAGAYDTPGVQEFVDGTEEDRCFYGLLDPENPQNAIALFMQTSYGTWQAWGNGDWLECDTPEISPQFIPLDDECALYLAGALFDSPDSPVDLRSPNPEAWDLAQAALSEIDWTLVDRAMVAAAPVSQAQADYTPEERSQNASKQIRDANGRFAEVGAAGAIKSTGIGGTILKADAHTNTVTVKGDDGNSYEVPASDFEVGAAAHPKVDPSAAKGKVDFSGILSPVPTPVQPKANLAKGAGPILGPVQIKDAIDAYTDEITNFRQNNAKNFAKVLNPGEDVEQAVDGLQASGEPDSNVSAADDVPPPSVDPTPDESDVPPIYLAIVARDDPQSVMDLVALVPASATSSEPKTFRRSGGSWVEDPSILQDLRSATPPPIIQLNADQYKDVISQIDTDSTTPSDGEMPTEEPQTITSAGGLDRNRGDAEKLRRYWTVGEGGLKIRWGTGGDWTRCVRLLSKYLGPRAKGYCALRHHEMTGMWPGDRANREMAGQSLTASGLTYPDTEIKTLPAVIRASAEHAQLEVARAKVFGTYEYAPVPQTADSIDSNRQGREFKIPLVIPENLPTGDGRIFGKGALGMRTLPLPLMWQIKTGEGHDGAVLVGRIDRVERIPGGLGNAYGVFDTGPYGQEAQRLVESQMLRWISADLDKFEIDENRSDEKTGKMFIKKGRLMGATLVPKPAFQECTIELIPLEENTMPVDAEPSAIIASASIAEAIPVEPPSVWFDRPVLNGPTPITVTNDGHIFGHIATWDRTHIGLGGEVRAPRSSSNYAYFHTGVVRTAEGNDVRVGQLTLSGGHAPIHLDASSAVRHYDDTASAVADVHVGEDSYGIWVAGALRPGVTANQIRSLRASAPSGDWRAINRRLELVAICQVNVPGFPVPRSLAASGAMTTLVAAGTSTLVEMLAHQSDDEREALVAAAADRLDRALGVDDYISTFKSFSPEKRKELAKDGKALPDGSYPIENTGDLQRAVRAYGRAPESKRAAVRRHIVKRARALGKPDAIPSNWKEASMSESSINNRDRYDALVASAREQKLSELRARVARPLTADEMANAVAELRARINK